MPLAQTLVSGVTLPPDGPLDQLVELGETLESIRPRRAVVGNVSSPSS